MFNYKITNIEVKKRSFLKAINGGLSPNVNEIELSLECVFYFLWLIPIKLTKVSTFALHVNYDIHDYLKVGDEFCNKKYESFKIN